MTFATCICNRKPAQRTDNERETSDSLENLSGALEQSVLQGEESQPASQVRNSAAPAVKETQPGAAHRPLSPAEQQGTWLS